MPGNDAGRIIADGDDIFFAGLITTIFQKKLSLKIRATLACRPTGEARQHDAAIATRAVRYSARDLLSQRCLLESLAHCHPGRRARRRRTQGTALADRSGASRRAIWTRAPRGGAADQRRC